MIKTKKTIYKNFNSLLQKDLKDSKLAVAYLNEALQDPDHNVFLLALKDVLAAQGKDVTSLAKEIQISRQSLHRILSEDGNPRWNNITALFDTLGYRVQIARK